MTDALQTPTEPLRFERTYTIGADFPTRFARAYFRYILTQPRRVVPMVIILVSVGTAVALSNLKSQPLIFPVVFVIALVATYTFGYFATVRQLRRRLPVGSIFGVGFRPGTFVVRSPQVTSEVAYSLYKSCERRGTFVVLRQRVSRIASFLPAEIFTEESFEYLRAQVGLSAPRP